MASDEAETDSEGDSQSNSSSDKSADDTVIDHSGASIAAKYSSMKEFFDQNSSSIYSNYSNELVQYWMDVAKTENAASKVNDNSQ